MGSACRLGSSWCRQCLVSQAPQFVLWALFLFHTRHRVHSSTSAGVQRPGGEPGLQCTGCWGQRDATCSGLVCTSLLRCQDRKSPGGCWFCRVRSRLLWPGWWWLMAGCWWVGVGGAHRAPAPRGSLSSSSCRGEAVSHQGTCCAALNALGLSV